MYLNETAIAFLDNPDLVKERFRAPVCKKLEDGFDRLFKKYSFDEKGTVYSNDYWNLAQLQLANTSGYEEWVEEASEDTGLIVVKNPLAESVVFGHYKLGLRNAIHLEPTTGIVFAGAVEGDEFRILRPVMDDFQLYFAEVLSRLEGRFFHRMALSDQLMHHATY